MEHLMLDLETLGLNENAVITQIGAIYFNPKTGVVGDTFIRNIDIDNSIKEGHTIDADALLWWLRQPREDVSWIKDTVTISQALHEYAIFTARKLSVVWCHTTFDAPIIGSASKKHNVLLPYTYKNYRDIRTLMDLMEIDIKTLTLKKKKTHNALEDCMYQAEYVTIAMQRYYYLREPVENYTCLQE